MELHRYLDVLYRRKAVVIGVVVAAVAAAGAVSLLLPERWTATATVRLEPSSIVAAGAVHSDDLPYRDRLVNTYARMVTSEQLRDRVARSLGLRSPLSIDVEDVPDTNLLEVRAQAADSRSAARAADAAARELVATVRRSERSARDAIDADFRRRSSQAEAGVARIVTEIERLEASVLPDDRARIAELRETLAGRRARLSTVREQYEGLVSMRDARANAIWVASSAAPPDGPSNRRLGLALPLGLLLGLLAGIGVAFVAENLSPRLRDGDDVEAAVGAPLLGAIPLVRRRGARAGYDQTAADGEAVRRLRTTLLLPPHRRGGSILVASADRGDGKTTLVAALARSLAAAGRSVVAVDADLRSPALARALDARVDRGLGQLLARGDAADVGAVLAHCHATDVPGLTLLAAGRPVADPATLLGSDAMGFVVDALAQEFDFVLLDSPAILAVADALAVARHVDGVLLVARARSARASLRAAARDLERAGAPPFGVVVNGADERDLYPPHRDPEPAGAPA